MVRVLRGATSRSLPITRRRRDATLHSRTDDAPGGEEKASPVRGAKKDALGGRVFVGAGLVQEEPVEADDARGFVELLEVDRLDDVAVDAEVVTLDRVLIEARRRQHDDRQLVRARIRS